MRPPRVRRPIRRALAIATAVVAAATATTIGVVAAGASEPYEPQIQEQVSAQALTWSDEFNAAAGTAPNSAKWNFDTGGGGWGNNEHQYYTNSTSNAAHDGNGNMVITARKENPANYQCWYGTCQYTSARLLTQGKFTQAYGTFEARIQIPRGQGIWPAFWMLGDDIGSVGWPQSGEIDIMENVGFEPNSVHGTLHGPGYSGGAGPSGTYTIGEPFANGFHTFAVNWSPNSISWSVDGVTYQTKTTADIGGNEWVFDHPFFMILNVAVGGNWPGYPDGSTQFPQTMKIDYVRVYSGSASSGGAITGLAGKCLDVEASGTADGTPVQLYTCNGTNAQKWTTPGDGTLRALGKCLDVKGGGTADGTVVQLWTCNGTAAQQWAFSSANDIVNPQANKCLDVPWANSADGTNLQIVTCSGNAAQKWFR
ncbi:ricin-type beta-trefoil lectin domain protein [Glycomyces mayteni]|uniref:Ricin-type beta-trefoil lectin domain protein n=1 Tax=Glycomyces mayteni TaxID=543887 RepID=A0ABW2DCH0_9ACTN|nr:glycoside hydrolase family 16 protein [Glycomyces mayteni]